MLLLSVCNYSYSQESLYNYDVEQRIVELGIDLQAHNTISSTKIESTTRSGNLVYTSGKVPVLPNGEKVTGKLGQDLTIEQGYAAARLVAISHLVALKAEIGDLNKIVKIIKVLGLVNATADFTDHSKVINGYTDLMIEIFGERGRHARTAVGMASLPLNFACEIEAIVEVID
ncbi:RidA family protein [Flavobacterium sp. K5-23]|uniref:RidA family protein n=1 Tax=Flavobacterium sp. K5-23 TaxID=2746225 RepID=UPI00200BF4CC|nr:RidA family protein [Flavobacterium sp. K5-23]